MKNFFIFFGLLGIIFISCSNNDITDAIDNDVALEGINLRNTTNNEKYLSTFAKVFSKTIHDSKAVREFIRDESLKQFDKNYDVLYYLVKDEYIGEKKFRDILISYSSIETIEEIERNVPLLNIYVSKIAFFNILPENIDTEDNELPVAVSGKSETTLFFNGNEELILEKGEVPNFHVFVVNENSRVIIPDDKSNGLKSCAAKTIKFKSSNYDGSIKNEQSVLKSATTDFSVVGQKAINAFKIFNKDDGSINQLAFQRDYVYYGIAPQKQIGSLNKSVSEYISFIEINPNAYFKIADQRNTNFNNNDPYVRSSSTTKKKRTLTQTELLDRLWTKGAYDFRFEIMTSTEAQAQIVYIPLRPDEIWNFNISHSRRHSTWVRSSKNTYKIDPNKFTSKKVFLNKKVPLGKWNISEEALFRHIKIYEEDESADETETDTYDMTTALKLNFNGNGKVGVGLKVVNAENAWSAGVESTTTEKVSKSITIKRKLDSDPLGKVKVYFYDPLIESVDFSKGTCKMHTYNTGIIDFGISVK